MKGYTKGYWWEWHDTAAGRVGSTRLHPTSTLVGGRRRALGERLGEGHQGGEVGRRAPGGEVGRRRVPGGRGWGKEGTRGERLGEGGHQGGEVGRRSQGGRGKSVRNATEEGNNFKEHAYCKQC